VQQLTALDQLFLALESDSHYGHVGGLAILDPSTAPGGRLTLEDLQRTILERRHLLPPMTRKLAEVPLGIDRPYWVEDERFDVGYHVRELALPAPGSDEQLAEQVARIFSRRLDRHRPLWELYLIHGLPEGRVAVMTKIHHAMVDGMSGAEIMGILYDLSPEGRELPGADVVRHEDPEPVDGPRMLLRAATSAPGRTLRTVGHLVPNLDVVPSILGLPGARTASRTLSRVTGRRDGDGEVLERPRLRAPRVPFSGRISPHRRFAFGSISLEEVKQVKNAMGVKVNDVVVALVAGAVREWLVEHDALPDVPVVAQIPVSVRQPDQVGTFGNRVSIMLVPIATHLDDPVERLQATAAQLRTAKERHGAMPAELLQDATAFIPPALHARATRAALALGANPRMRPMYNLIVSNVPGPPIPIYMAGAELEAHYPISVIADGSGLNVTIMSYRDRVDVGIVACREQMPDLPVVLDGVRTELARLLDACARVEEPPLVS
jgi:diacylglycerol O-acyltransferase / wax synthase